MKKKKDKRLELASIQKTYIFVFVVVVSFLAPVSFEKYFHKEVGGRISQFNFSYRVHVKCTTPGRRKKEKKMNKFFLLCLLDIGEKGLLLYS